MRAMLFCVLASACVYGAGWNVRDMGARGDGSTDDTAAFQAALEAAAEAGGGIVEVSSGHYRIGGVLRIPGGVTLQGTFRVPPNEHREARPSLDGSVLQAYAGRGAPASEPFITLSGSMATLAGFTITYPEWNGADVPPIAYPPTVYAGYTANVGVLDCFFLNSYDAIHFQDAFRFLIRNVYGYPSHRGLYVDNCLDVGRVENGHFWPFGVYAFDDPYRAWVRQNGVAFEFARTDWQYVLNTFCFGYGVGYKFSKSEHGTCNGNFVGIGADSCERPILVEDCQFPGILITNGEFVGRWGGMGAIGLEVAESSGEGKVSLSNCSFWGPLGRCIWNRSARTQVTATGCNFHNWDAGALGEPAIQIDRGKAIIQGSTFGAIGTHVLVGEAVLSAVVLGNQAAGGLAVDNRAGSRTQALANEPPLFADWPDGALDHYRLDLGADGDGLYGWQWAGPETAWMWSDGDRTMRWSEGVSSTSRGSVLRLPVKPGTVYSVEVDLYVPEAALDSENGVYMASERVVRFPSHEGIAVATGSLKSGASGFVALRVQARGWSPKETTPESDDSRILGVAVRSVTLRSVQGGQPAGGAVFDVVSQRANGGATDPSALN